MLAVRLTDKGVSLADVPRPVPGPGQALVAVAGAGLCHSDLTLMGRAADAHPFSLPITLGHELSGTVVDLGPGVSEFALGDTVVGYGPRGCGTCRRCRQGAANRCATPHRNRPPGLGADGALAGHVVVDAEALLAADGVDLVSAAVLTDAGLTSWHAINRALPDRDGTVVVIGVGGLGHMAVQFLSLWHDVTVIAIDRDPGPRAYATAHGAVSVTPEAGRTAVAEMTERRGADAVIDFVASADTLSLAASLLSVGGTLSIVGVGNARLAVGAHALPLESRVDLPFWGTRDELLEVMDMCRRGLVEPMVEQIELADALTGYERLRRGDVTGRLVAVPESTS